MKIIVAITGASGTILGERLVKNLVKIRDETNLIREIHLIISESAKKVAEYEGFDEYGIKNLMSIADYCYMEDEIDAKIASSSYTIDAMVVIPCSIKTLSAIANGFCDNLITRSAENISKLNKKLVIVPRDTPLSLAAIENMKRVKLSGGIILPPNMAYYNKPETVDDVTNFFVGKVLDVLDIEHSLYKKYEKIQRN